MWRTIFAVVLLPSVIAAQTEFPKPEPDAYPRAANSPERWR